MTHTARRTFDGTYRYFHYLCAAEMRARFFPGASSCSGPHHEGQNFRFAPTPVEAPRGPAYVRAP